MDYDELRPIPGFPGYRITRDGRIWSDKRNIWRKNSDCGDGLFLQLGSPWYARLP